MFLAACLKETSFLSESTENYVYEIAYEEETNSFQEFPQGKTHETASLMQQICNVPVVKRQKIHIGILEDGSSEWEITQMKPKQDFDLPKGNISSPAPYRTLMKNNEIYYFDKAGKLLYKTAGETPNFSDFLYKIKENQHQNSFKKLKSDNNSTVKYLNDSIAEITKLLTNLDEIQNPDLLGKTYKSIVNIKQNLTLAEAFYDENNEAIYVKQNAYDKKREVPIPVFSKTMVKHTNSQGEANVVVNISQCEKIQITNNL